MNIQGKRQTYYRQAHVHLASPSSCFYKLFCCKLLAVVPILNVVFEGDSPGFGQFAQLGLVTSSASFEIRLCAVGVGSCIYFAKITPARELQWETLVFMADFKVSGEHGLLVQRGRCHLARHQEKLGEAAGCTRCLVAMAGDLEKFGLAETKAIDPRHLLCAQPVVMARNEVAILL